MEKPVDLILKALTTVRDIADPIERFKAANDLDARLAEARTVTLQMKREALEDVRTDDFGYKRIADTLGLTKSRIQQITKTPPALRVYAIRDEAGTWYPAGAETAIDDYEEGVIHFQPAESVTNALAGQDLTARFGAVDFEWSLYAVNVDTGNGTSRRVATTRGVHDAMFGDW